MADELSDSPAPDALVERAFEEYWHEMEGFAARHERGFDELGERADEWCRAAFKTGYESALSRPDAVQAAVDAERSDTERLDYLESGCLDVRWKSGDGTEMCSPSDEVGLIIVSHQMAQPKERIEAENWNHNLRAAIDEAITEGGRDA